MMSALRDPSAAGLEALAKTVDMDRFLSFWVTEVIVGHWDGYAGNRNNYRFYREPDGAFVFIPWGVDGTFHLKDDPNPFDNISNPPPSVLALSAIPSRLYGDADWRLKYVGRLKELLDTDHRQAQDIHIKTRSRPLYYGWVVTAATSSKLNQLRIGDASAHHARLALLKCHAEVSDLPGQHRRTEREKRDQRAAYGHSRRNADELRYRSCLHCTQW